MMMSWVTARSVWTLPRVREATSAEGSQTVATVMTTALTAVRACQTGGRPLPGKIVITAAPSVEGSATATEIVEASGTGIAVALEIEIAAALEIETVVASAIETVVVSATETVEASETEIVEALAIETVVVSGTETEEALAIETEVAAVASVTTPGGGTAAMVPLVVVVGRTARPGRGLS